MSDELQRLRELLAVADADRQLRVEARLETVETRLQRLPDDLPETIDAAGRQGPELARALRQPLQQSIEHLARERRELLAEAIFPVIGPAIRRAITEALRELVLNLNRLLESAFTPRGLRWRWQAWRSGVPYAQVALRELLRFRVDHLFLVQNGSGLVLASARQRDLDSDRDTDAVAAMLTAIRDFARDAGLAPGDAELSEVTLGEHLLRLYAGPQAYLAAAITGVPGEEVDGALTELLEFAHLRYDAQLQAGEPTEALQQHLQQWLDTAGLAQAERPATNPASARRPWLGIMAVTTMLLLLAGWLGERVWTGWQRATLSQLLQQEPGYAVRVERVGWRQLQVSGLRDPAARSPDELLTGQPLAVAIQWRTTGYLALDDQLQLQRLRAALRPPPSVSLRLAAGRVQLSGAAPRAWREQAAALLRAWPGLNGVLDEVADLDPVPSPVAPARWEVPFEPGQTANPAGAATFDEVALAWQQMPDSRLLVRAQTDATGTPAQNAALGQQRAQWATVELTRRGVPLSVIVTSSVQATDSDGEDAKLRRVVLQLEPTTTE